MKTIYKIVKQYLVDNDFDGLYSEDCGCQIDDLMPCDQLSQDCKPGYKKECAPNNGWDFIIGPKKQMSRMNIPPIGRSTKRD